MVVQNDRSFLKII